MVTLEQRPFSAPLPLSSGWMAIPGGTLTTVIRGSYSNERRAINRQQEALRFSSKLRRLCSVAVKWLSKQVDRSSTDCSSSVLMPQWRNFVKLPEKDSDRDQPIQSPLTPADAESRPRSIRK